MEDCAQGVGVADLAALDVEEPLGGGKLRVAVGEPENVL